MNKNSIWKRMLSSLLIAVMLVTMLPGMAFAAVEPQPEDVLDTKIISTNVKPAEPTDTKPEAVDKAVWILKETEACTKEEHTHVDGCYTTPNVLACKHHLESLLLGHPEDCVEINYNETCTNYFGCGEPHKYEGLKRYHVTFKCTHVHTKDCYTLGCDFALKGEHTHDEGCFVYIWELYADVNSNGLRDIDETFTIKYVNGGEVLQTSTHLVGTEYPAYEGEEPSKAADAQYTYTFSGWDVEAAETVTGDVTHTAQFSTTINKYTVVWYDEDGTTVLETDENVPYGTLVSFDGETPTKESDGEDKVWIFTGWTPVVTEATVVTGNVEYVATFTDKDVFAVEYNVEGASKTVYVIDGETVGNYAPERTNYTLNGWYTDAECTQEFNFSTPITEPTALYAVWTPNNDGNNDGVADEEQLCTVTVTADNAKVTGTVSAGTQTVNPGVAVTVTVTPDTNYYVLAENVEGTDDYSLVTENGVYTYTFTTGISQSYSIEVTCAPIIAGKADAEINKYIYLKWVNGDPDTTAETVKAEIIDKAFETVLENDHITVEYLAGSINVKDIIKAVVEKYADELDAITEYIVNGIVDLIPATEYPVWANVEHQKDDIYGKAIDSIFEKAGRLTDLLGYINITEEELKSAIVEYLNEGSNLHTFGAQETESVKATHTCTTGCEYGPASANADITMVDLRAEVDVDINTAITVAYGDYTNAELIAKLLEGKTGVMLDGEALADHNQLITIGESLEGKSVGTYTVEVYMDDVTDFDHKDAQKATATVTVKKAPVNLSIEDLTVKHGISYDPTPVITNSKGAVVNAETIEFIVGLDVSEFDIDGDNIKGLEGKVQLMLPSGIQGIFDLIGLENGVTLSLNDLMKTLNNDLVGGLLEGSGLSSELVDALGSALDGINNIVEAGNMEITIGGSYPSNIGAYLHGAVTVDGNYETAYDLGYIVITPDGYKAELGWNQEDSNGIITGNIVDEFDFGASVVKVHQGTIEGAQAHLKTFFMGVNANGEPTLTADPSELQFGLYTQLAFIVDAGNTMYYAEPIVRVFTITPQIDTVEVADTEVVYDGTAKEVNVTVVLQDGSAVDETGLKVTYVGVDTQGNAYNSEEPPVNTGVYTVFATYAAKVDGVYEHVGFDAGVLVIKPAAATQTVADTYVIWDGAEHLPTITNDDNLDLIKVIVDENNNVNIVFPEYFGIGTASVNVADPVNDLKAIFEDVSGDYAAAEAVIAKLAAELDKIDVEKLLCIGADKTAAFITDLKADVAEAGEVLAKYDVDAVAAKIADLLGQIDVNTITVNGTLPIEDGVYDVTVVGFGPNHRPAASEGTLTIHKHDVIVDDGDCTTPVVCRCEVVLVAAKSHDFTGDYLEDVEGHWHVCQNADCTVTDTKAGHEYGTDDKCDVCGYDRDHVHSHSQDWSSDETNHWHECVCGDKAGLGTHADIDNDRACDTCGAPITATPTPGPTGPVGGGAAPVDPLKPYRDAADKAIDEAEAAEADLYTAIADEIKAIGDDAHAKVKAAKTKEEIFAIEAEAKAKIAELKLVCDVESSYIVARSKCMKAPSGKDSIRIKWYDKYGRVVKFEGVEIFRSTKRNEGYKKMYTSVTDQYYNTAIEIGVKYFYKVRGYVTINGEKVYTDWSLKAIRTAKEL